MSLLAFLLIPSILALEQETAINNHIVKINESTLISVNPTLNQSFVVNLSGLKLQFIKENAFENLAMLKNLDLSNNSLSSIPKEVFSKLTNLEHLSLADNSLTNFLKIYEGLDNLKTLNISNNPLTRLEARMLSGLPNSCTVFTKGLQLIMINALVFEKEPETTPSTFMIDEISISNDQNQIRRAQEQNELIEMEWIRLLFVDMNQLIKICIDGDVLKTVEHLEENEALPHNCRRGEVDKHSKKLDLRNLSIAKVEKNWYRLNTTIRVLEILFTENNIVSVTPELINDLPSEVSCVNLGHNKIERLETDIFENAYISEIIMSSNAIREIENGTFTKMTNLRELHFDDNLLKSTRFIASLPERMEFLYVKRNNITEILPHSFSKLSSLLYLRLDGNLIQEIESNSFLGLHYLLELGLSNNRISKIAPESFQNLFYVSSINLKNNTIFSFENGTFDNQHNLKHLDVSYNKLSDIKITFPNGVPPNLNALDLSFNEIQKLESDNFKNVPLKYLILSGNKISKIEHGALELPALETLELDNNELTQLETGSFRGLKKIYRIELGYNSITSIPKGFTKNMDVLEELDLSSNPIRQLQNGALFGLQKTVDNNVYLRDVPIEIIEGGLFDSA